MTEHVEHGGHAAEHGHSVPHVNYWAIFGALCVLTVVSAAADFIFGKSGESHAAVEHVGVTGKQIALVLVVMAVAIAKALFVMAYFMHVKFEGKWIYAMLLPTIVLAMAIPAALLPDIGVHYYTIQTAQTEEHARKLSGHSTLGAAEAHTDPVRDPKAHHPSEPAPGEGRHPESEKQLPAPGEPHSPATEKHP